MKVRFYGIDRFNRPIFKAIDKPKEYYGCVDKLFDYGAKEEEVLAVVDITDITYFGNKFDCEPWGTVPDEMLEIVKKGTK